MCNPFTIFAELAEYIVNTIHENDDIAQKQRIEKERIKEQEKFERKQREYKEWKKATDEEHKNPDEWRVLPYGWSPFGIYL